MDIVGNGELEATSYFFGRASPYAASSYS